MHRQTVDEPPAGRLVVEEQGLGDREIGDDVDLLGDDDDAVALRISDVARPVGGTIDRQLAGVVLPEQPGEHPDDRRLAGPVLAEQGDDLPLPQLEGEVGDGAGVPERLTDVIQAQDATRFVHASYPTGLSVGGFVGGSLLRQHSGRSSGTLVYTSSTFCQY